MRKSISPKQQLLQWRTTGRQSRGAAAGASAAAAVVVDGSYSA
jgi:hypothetical protein